LKKLYQVKNILNKTFLKNKTLTRDISQNTVKKEEDSEKAKMRQAIMDKETKSQLKNIIMAKLTKLQEMTTVELYENLKNYEISKKIKFEVSPFS